MKSLRKHSQTLLNLQAKTQLIHGRSQMAELIRSYDWSDSEMGPLSEWTNSLRSAVNLMLGCGFPTAIWWGGDGVQFYNDGYKPLMAERRPSGLGQLAKDCWKEAWDLVSPQVQDVMEHGKPLLFENYLVPVERDGVRYSPIFGADGNTEGVLVTCQDVTDAFLSSQKVAQSREELKQVLDSITDGLLVVNKDWRYTYFNEQGATMIGLRREDLIGEIVWDLFPQAKGTAFYEGYHRAVKTGQPVHFEEFYPEPLNKWLECNCYPSVQGLSVYFRDITKQKAAEDALRKSTRLQAVNKELEQFAYVASHDLKAPLRVIDNASQWLEEDLAEHLTADTREIMRLLRGRVQRMGKLLDDLLDYARIGREPDNYLGESVTGDVLINDVLALLPTINFTVAVSPCLSGIQINRMPLQRILLNLIGNAIKHHDKPEGRIEVTVIEQRESYEFAVHDDGPGIPGQYHEQIFKMFQTLRPRDQVEGSGMGLTLARKTVESFGGELRVESAEGQGCTFRFTWPKDQRSGREAWSGEVLDNR